MEKLSLSTPSYFSESYTISDAGLGAASNRVAWHQDGWPAQVWKPFTLSDHSVLTDTANMVQAGLATEAIGYELFVIAAAVIGCAILRDGRVTILGTLNITILRNGGVKMGWPQYTQEIVMDAVIIVAVAIDNLRQRKRT